MALDPSDAAGLPANLIALYSDAELALIAALAEAIAAGIDTPEWEARQPLAMLRFRQQAEALASQLQAAMPAMVEAAVAGAAAVGKAAADEDIDEDPKAAPAPPERQSPDPRTRQAMSDGWRAIATATQRLPGAAGELYGQVVARVQASTTPTSEGTRLDAVQQALDILTKRGIAGFRDNRGRNWSLSTYVEMKSRTIVNQELIAAHTDRMLERGYDLIVVSSHSNPAPQCQPYEGQVLSLGGETGTVIRPNATGGAAVKVHIKATLAEARSHGFQHPNCRHAVSRYIPGASRTFTTKPDPEGYAATQKQRALEREIRDVKRRLAVSVTPAAKRANTARLRGLQGQMREHLAATGLTRRPRREQVTAEHRFGRPGDPGNPTTESPRGPAVPPSPPVPPKTGGGGGDDGEPPRRHLVFGRKIEHTELGDLGADKIDPPSYRLLEESGLIARDDNPSLYHDAKERYTSEWLTSRGLHTRSVDRRTDDGEKTPDSVLNSEALTVELKMLEGSGAGSVSRNIRNARKQSRRIVVDGRRVDLTSENAEKGLREALRKYGSQIDEVLIILGDAPDDAISWTNG